MPGERALRPPCQGIVMTGDARNPGRLLVFFDEPYFRIERGGQEVITTNRAFWLFIRALAPAFDHVYFLARIFPEPKEAPFACTPDPRFSLWELPYYESLYSLGGLLRGMPAQLRVFWTAIGACDAVLLGIPHPACLILWAMARLRRRPVIFLDRQDLIARAQLRAPGAARRAIVFGARALVRAFVLLSRNTLTFAVGGEMHRRYARPGAPAHTLLISLVREKDLDGVAARLLPGTEVPRRLLWVGRLDPDKGLEVLLDAFRMVNGRHPDQEWHLDLIGTGLIEKQITQRATDLGLARSVHLHGFVPFGPELNEHYDRATAYALPSNESEGFPQVLIEAMARALPVIATAVAGIPYALHDGENALLLPPRDPHALAAAIERMLSDPALYRRCSENGLRFAREHTLEAQTKRFLQEALPYIERGRGPA